MNIAKTPQDKKASELFYRVSLKKGFQREVRECRKQFGIPENGFNSEEGRRRWFSLIAKKEKDDEGDYGRFLDVCEELVRKYKLPLWSWNVLEEYVLTRGMFTMWPVLGSSFFVRLSDDKEEKECKERGLPYVKLLIFDGATREDVASYIQNHWKAVTKDLKSKGGRTQRIRFAQNKERDEKIFELSLIKREVLKSRYGVDYKYKDTQIARIIEKIYGVRLSDGNIRKITSRQKKMRGL